MSSMAAVVHRGQEHTAKGTLSRRIGLQGGNAQRRYIDDRAAMLGARSSVPTQQESEMVRIVALIPPQISSRNATTAPEPQRVGGVHVRRRYE